MHVPCRSNTLANVSRRPLPTMRGSFPRDESLNHVTTMRIKSERINDVREAITTSTKQMWGVSTCDPLLRYYAYV